MPTSCEVGTIWTMTSSLLNNGYIVQNNSQRHIVYRIMTASVRLVSVKLGAKCLTTLSRETVTESSCDKLQVVSQKIATRNTYDDLRKKTPFSSLVVKTNIKNELRGKTFASSRSYTTSIVSPHKMITEEGQKLDH